MSVRLATQAWTVRDGRIDIGDRGHTLFHQICGICDLFHGVSFAQNELVSEAMAIRQVRVCDRKGRRLDEHDCPRQLNFEP